MEALTLLDEAWQQQPDKEPSQNTPLQGMARNGMSLSNIAEGQVDTSRPHQCHDLFFQVLTTVLQLLGSSTSRRTNSISQPCIWIPPTMDMHGCEPLRVWICALIPKTLITGGKRLAQMFAKPPNAVDTPTILPTPNTSADKNVPDKWKENK